jgi:hypothetical protein
MFELRDYQQKASKQGLEILNKHHILILNYEVRTKRIIQWLIIPLI